MSGANGGRGRGGRKSSGRTRRESSAGGVVFRVAEGRALFLLICDSYGNWGFPKGHLERGERADSAALREVVEETGLRTVAVYSTADEDALRVREELRHAEAVR